jgi:hypothetical protein
MLTRAISYSTNLSLVFGSPFMLQTTHQNLKLLSAILNPGERPNKRNPGEQSTFEWRKKSLLSPNTSLMKARFFTTNKKKVQRPVTA